MHSVGCCTSVVTATPSTSAGRVEQQVKASELEDQRGRLVSMVAVIALFVGALLVIAFRSGGNTSAALRGHPVIVTFGASWCHPCYQEYPLLVRAAALHAGRLVVVSVMYEDVKADEVRFLRREGVHWAAIDDTSNAIAEAYQVHGLPETFFITPQGVLQARGWGLTTQRALDGPLQRLLAAPAK